MPPTPAPGTEREERPAVSVYAEVRAYLEAGRRTRAGRRLTVADAIPTEYKGITFRSALEAAWARTLDRYEIEWQYEPETVRLASGKRYIPDFRLGALRTFIEVKGPHMLRTDKTREFARQEGPKVITLLGFSSLQRSVSPFLWQGYMQWADPLGYDMRFTQCGDCSAWQWLRPEVSRRCRRCGKTCGELLAKAGELEFAPPAEGPAFRAPSWFRTA